MQERVSDPPYETRLTALFAAKARVAVILRRGPKRSFRLVTWNLATDTFVRGQWIRGIVRLCDLSPDGTKLAYWAAQYHRTSRTTEGEFDPLRAGAASTAMALAKRNRKVPRYLARLAGGRRGLPRLNTGMWTAISTPPYFTALAIWPSLGTWTGGAVFASDREMILNESADGMVAVENVPIPAAFRVSAWAGRERFVQSAAAPGAGEESTRKALLDAGCLWVDWIGHERLDMLFAADGCVYRLPGWKDVAKSNYLAAAKILIDLRDDSFSNIKSPASALRW